MKVFILICIIAILLLISRIYYEKQIEGLDNINNDTTPKSTSEVTTDIEDPSLPSDDVPMDKNEIANTSPVTPAPNSMQIEENEDANNSEDDDENKYNPLKIIEKMDQIKKLTSGVKKQISMVKQQDKKPKNLEEHGDFCNCKSCKNNFYINQHFHNYAPPVESKKTPVAGGLLSDDFDNVNFFLNKLSSSQLNKKNRGKSFAEFGTKLKAKKLTKPKYAKMESITGMFTARGPKPFNH